MQNTPYTPQTGMQNTPYTPQTGMNILDTSGTSDTSGYDSPPDGGEDLPETEPGELLSSRREQRKSWFSENPSQMLEKNFFDRENGITLGTAIKAFGIREPGEYIKNISPFIDIPKTPTGGANTPRYDVSGQIIPCYDVSGGTTSRNYDSERTSRFGENPSYISIGDDEGNVEDEDEELAVNVPVFEKVTEYPGLEFTGPRKVNPVDVDTMTVFMCELWFYINLNVARKMADWGKLKQLSEMCTGQATNHFFYTGWQLVPSTPKAGLPATATEAEVQSNNPKLTSLNKDGLFTIRFPPADNDYLWGTGRIKLPRYVQVTTLPTSKVKKVIGTAMGEDRRVWMYVLPTGNKVIKGWKVSDVLEGKPIQLQSSVPMTYPMSWLLTKVDPGPSHFGSRHKLGADVVMTSVESFPKPGVWIVNIRKHF
ncbi:uncharacterized protein DFL_005290 [Arthrobotrys flagrans]|uniref:Uncharacterized protein n=1 Tax=Arthrobotrys flagrans TaxID=97331 RepID=A0A437A7B2_ARTFL|nr:hypothetical protein DFL_005290 [Arthrobotrys flagrans]